MVTKSFINETFIINYLKNDATVWRVIILISSQVSRGKKLAAKDGERQRNNSKNL